MLATVNTTYDLLESTLTDKQEITFACYSSQANKKASSAYSNRMLEILQNSKTQEV
jgi:hypothetical protein